MKTHLDLFSGIGGFAKGFLDAGFKFDKHYFSEIDKHAIANYKHNFPNAELTGAIQDVSGRNIGRPNLITFGFPCQDLSIAGKRKGLTGKRSGLYHEALRLINETKPDIFIFENVEGLLSSNEGKDFEIVLQTISDIGLYECEWQLLNSSWFLPQNRERIYFAGHLRGKSRPKIFPIIRGGEEIKGVVYAQKADREIARIYDVSGISPALHRKTGGWQEPKIKVIGNIGNGHEAQNVYDKNGLAPAVRGMHGKVTKTMIGDRIRKLTPTEMERLQGFPDGWTMFGNYDGEIKKVSQTHRYNMLGNAVTVSVVKEIATRIKQV